jgi:hypothetical protein
LQKVSENMKLFEICLRTNKSNSFVWFVCKFQTKRTERSNVVVFGLFVLVVSYVRLCLLFFPCLIHSLSGFLTKI